MKNRTRLANLTALLLGVAITLLLRGYQFGQGNHTVYLLDALRVNDPRLLAKDWFTTQTYQYHFVFTHVTALLDRLGIVRPVFASAYLLLLGAWHVAWFKLTTLLGGSRRTYLWSVVLFFVSAGGLGLGVYDFVQDASLLPSNLANVAMLWGILFLIANRPAPAGLMLGVAGFFHLNHATVVIGLWFVLFGREYVVSNWRRIGEAPKGPAPMTGWGKGTVALVVLCVVNMLPAARAAWASHDRLPLGDFVNLYVRMRHPHHYDPSSWPVALWVSFIWPIPIALAVAHRTASPIVARARRVFYLLAAVVILGLTCAGVWYVSETFVQLSLARFSIYLKLLSCVGAAFYFERLSTRRTFRLAAAVAPVVLGPVALLAAIHVAQTNDAVRTFLVQNRLVLVGVWVAIVIAIILAMDFPRPTSRPVCAALAVLIVVGLGLCRGDLGLRVAANAGDSADYLAVCDYARDRTPVDAIFVVPPSEEQFRLRGRRAIVVNFKGVPQFSGELVAWRKRLCDVYDVPDLDFVPHRFDLALRTLAARYAALPPKHLLEVASVYGARYVVSSGDAALPAPARAVFEKGRYRLYDLAR